MQNMEKSPWKPTAEGRGLGLGPGEDTQPRRGVALSLSLALTWVQHLEPVSRGPSPSH